MLIFKLSTSSLIHSGFLNLAKVNFLNFLFLLNKVSSSDDKIGPSTLLLFSKNSFRNEFSTNK